MEKEIAYLTSGFIRVVQRSADGWFEVQTKRFRGEGKAAPQKGNADGTHWARLYGVHDCEKAISLMESYA